MMMNMDSGGETTPQSALDAELRRVSAPTPDAAWREKVETAKEAREFGAQVRRETQSPTNYSTFPRY